MINRSNAVQLVIAAAQSDAVEVPQTLFLQLQLCGPGFPLPRVVERLRGDRLERGGQRNGAQFDQISLRMRHLNVKPLEFRRFRICKEEISPEANNFEFLNTGIRHLDFDEFLRPLGEIDDSAVQDSDLGRLIIVESRSVASD